MTANVRTLRFSPGMRAGLVAIAAAVAAPIVAVIGDSIVSAFGNEIDALFFQIASTVTGYVGPHLWTWAIFFLSIFGAIFLVGSPFMVLYIIVLHTTVNRYDSFWRADNSVLTTLANLDFSSIDQEKQKRRILEEVLRDGVAHFNESVNSAVVLLPDASGEYLHYHTCHRMDNERMQENMQFYIGLDSSKIRERGVAGTVYHNREAMVGHMREVDGRWVCDLKCYRDHRDSIMGRHPLYRSFICVPIKGVTEGDKNACLGVIYVDSKQRNIFDPDDVEIVLAELARRMAVAIVVCDKQGKTGSQKAARQPPIGVT